MTKFYTNTMNKKFKTAIILIMLSIGTFASFAKFNSSNNNDFVTYIADPKTQDIKLYWKNDQSQNFKSIQNLKLWLQKKNQKLEFATNAGMYKKDGSSQGLYIENRKTLSPLDSSNANGNFYLKPNGIFYITDKNIAGISITEKFVSKNIKYATQSGPMLIIDSEIHPAFNAESANLNIRNGVGILPNNKIVFAMSKKEINFYDFANYFKKLGCKNALYLDGFVSRTYSTKDNWLQTDGNFGVMIGITK